MLRAGKKWIYINPINYNQDFRVIVKFPNWVWGITSQQKSAVTGYKVWKPKKHYLKKGTLKVKTY